LAQALAQVFKHQFFVPSLPHQMLMARELLLLALASLAFPFSYARWVVLSGGPPLSPTLAETSEQTNYTTTMATLSQQDAMIQQIKDAWSTGFWSSADTGRKFGDSCGRSTFRDLSMNIPRWRAEHPSTDAFCYFSNQAPWLSGDGSVRDYREHGKIGRYLGSSSGPTCNYLGQSRGPERRITYDAGTITWNHLDHCVDLVDDPYCFSLGWLKNQHPQQHLMSNYTAWTELGKAECAKIQEEYQFMDEEVTVGRHIFSTPLYFKGAWCALYGGCPAIKVRTHKEHVYTKCVLGNVAPEMAYCYYKGCLLPGNRIGHGRECGYEDLFPKRYGYEDLLQK